MKKEIVAIGMFDGVHLGHQKVLKTAVSYSKRNKAGSVILTFDNIPQKQYGNLTTVNEKIKLIKSTGIKTVKIISFKKIRNLSPAEFFDLYLKNYAGIIVGYNFKFGKNRKGNADTIKHFCKNAVIVKPVKINKNIISSTNIKKYLISGKIKTVNKLLNRRYSFCGRIIKGFGLGRELGFSTANISVADNKLLPEGIFIAIVQIENKKYQSAVYIGKRPTFSGKIKSVEAYILDFSKKIYGKKINVELLSKIRNDKKFPSAEKLAKQIKNDLKITRKYFM